ncbi:MAG: metallophosphoesterase [Clostridia bacterium]|nr:metallophosphoesterase [Clostridia bacterium]
MDKIISLITSVILTLSTVISLIPDIAGTVKSYSPESGDVKLSCVVMSDTHADGDPFRDRNDKLRRIFAGVSECERETDAILNIGDITNSGSASEYRNLKRIEKVYCRVKNTVACLGNHDSWNQSSDPDYAEAKRLFLGYIGSHGIQSEEVYYSTVINGYHFICLGTEDIDHEENLPVYSEKQLGWFDAELTAAKESGLPVFVLCHRPLAGHNGIQTSSVPQRVDEILKAHSSDGKPVVIFSGHCHSFTPECFERDGNLCYMNLPSIQYNDETEYECNDSGGLGFAMEVSGDRIVFRARNFITDKWIDGYRYEVNF